jgi:glycerophosphoryl diester phosphodiesterase
MFKILILILLFTVSNMVLAKTNYGHRGGCESPGYRTMGIPENSLLCLEAGLMGYDGRPSLQHHKSFRYLEFDVRETLDHEIVVYHGGSKGAVFSRKKRFKKDHAAVPYKGHLENIETFKRFVDEGLKKSWKKVRVKDLTLMQIQRLKLKGIYDQHIPSLKEYLEMAAKLGVIKPVMVEIKGINTELGREKLMDIVSEFNETYATYADIIINENSSNEFETVKVGFMIRKQKIKSNLGKIGSEKFNIWCEDFVNMGFKGIFKTGSHTNICD